MCPKCKHTWDYEAKKTELIRNRTKCKCGANINIPPLQPSLQKTETSPKTSPKPDVAENILTGNIIEAIKQTGIDPKKKRGDFIPLLLQDKKLELCLARASKGERQSPEKIIREALMEYLKKNGYMNKKGEIIP